MEPVIGKDHDGDRRVAQVLRDVEDEAVVIDKNGVKILVEESLRDAALELVVAEVEVSERRETDDDVGEFPGEAVIAKVELEEEVEAAEGPGDDAAEAVGVDVKEGEVGEEAELVREVSGDVAMVKVDACDDDEVGVGGERGTVDGGVVADIGADPVGGEVLGIGEYGELPGLEGNVGVAEAGVGEDEGGVHRHVLAAPAELVPVREELPAPDETGLHVREAMAGEGGG